LKISIDSKEFSTTPEAIIVRFEKRFICRGLDSIWNTHSQFLWARIFVEKVREP